MDLLQVAVSQLGTMEISGDADNPQILKYASETGISGVNHDEVPWCSTFVNWCAHKSGLPMSGKANARSWMNVGMATLTPEPGDVVVFWRESPQSWKGHVGIFLGFNKNGEKVFCLGGNQGDAVTIAAFDAGKVLGYRRLDKTQNFSLPSPVLKRGDRGTRVIELQKLLNHLHYSCGDVDGIFGSKTENAIQLFHANNQLTVSGEYDQAASDVLESLMQS